MTNRTIHVTQPYLPPLEEFTPYLEEIWANKIVTNGGPFHQQLEEALCDYLGVQYISLFANGTLALVTALQALHLTGEVITTPYSFVATSNALLWNGLTPVFADVDPESFNLDPDKIEAAITPRTTAILPVHCYGHPCDVEGIERIAKRHNLRVLYDAAHTFGVRFRGNSLLMHGDLSVLSFHATKVFNTFEGGAIVSHDVETKRYIDRLRNFGFVDEVTIINGGINGKMSEINAAFGLVQLRHLDRVLQQRATLHGEYSSRLKDVKGIKLPVPPNDTVPNYGYFPILVGEDYPLSRDGLYQLLKSKNIHGRRYFFPLISNFPMYSHLQSARVENLPEANRLADQVICLPLYPALEVSDVHFIANIIANASA